MLNFVNKNYLNNKKKNNITIKRLTYYSFVIYLMTLYTFVENPNLYRISQIIFLIYVFFSILNIMNKDKILINYATIYFAILPFAFLISFFWASNTSIVWSNFLTVFQISILAIITYYNFILEEKKEKLIDGILIAGIFLSIYSVVFYGPLDIIQSMSSYDRIGGDIGQENTFGVNLAITVILCFYKAQYKKKYFYIVSIIPFILLIASGSRKALIILMIGIFLLIFLKYGMKHFLRLILTLLITFLLVLILLKLPTFSFMNERMKALFSFFSEEDNFDGSTKLRFEFLRLGYNLFLEKPLFGYGTGNFAVFNNIKLGYYSHNNYIELLVNNGIFVFSFYYFVYLYLVFKLSKFIKYDHVAKIIFILIIVSLVNHFGTVVYYDKLQYLIIIFSFIYLKNKKIDYINS